MENIQLAVTENGTKTLATAGKYCDRNIQVQVNVEDSSGYEAGFEEGKVQGEQAEHDRFWDVFQKNGERNSYFRAFTYCNGYGWTDEIYDPRYAIYCTGSNGARSVFEENGSITDVKVPMIVDGTAMNSTFYNAVNLKRIPSLTLQNGVTFTGDTFGGCVALEELMVYGAIVNNGLSFRSSIKLKHDSIASIINALSDTTSGLTVTLSARAKEAAFTADEWATLIATKPNWTISLV